MKERTYAVVSALALVVLVGLTAQPAHASVVGHAAKDGYHFAKHAGHDGYGVLKGLFHGFKHGLKDLGSVIKAV